MGFGSRRPTSVPLLNARHRDARLVWAREHRDWSVDDWERVAWGDESRFRLLNADRSLRIWRQAHEAIDPACQNSNAVFQQDNCTSHNSRLATDWLDEHSSDFSVINWHPRNLDLNRVEHLWDVLEQSVKGHHTQHQRTLLNHGQR
ncbi:transposable element Tc1 transposase [Trichonephila clavipes]|nr:transposable element Tc1 transposase [Trichonephila clavipes]